MGPTSKGKSCGNAINKQVTLLKFYLYKIAFDFKEDRIHTIKYILTTFWRGHGFIHYIDD